MRASVFSSRSFLVFAGLWASAASVQIVAASPMSDDAETVISIPGRLHEAQGPSNGATVRLSGIGGMGPIRTASPSAASPDVTSAIPEFSLGKLEPETPNGATRLGSKSAPRVGRVRPVGAEAAEKGTWSPLSDGRWVWRLAIRSPEAVELRVHFTDFAAGDGTVWVYGNDANRGEAQSFTGSGVHGDGDFWSASVAGDRLVIEYMAGNGGQRLQPGEALPFRLADAGHVWEATSTLSAQAAAPVAASLSAARPNVMQGAATAVFGASATSQREIAGCHLDVACYPDYKQAASGVARILFAADGGLFVCSGALVNTRSAAGTPLFMTANHCISNEDSARSVEASFFYQSESCGGGLRKVETVLGANYLISEPLSRGDYSLIRLLGLPSSPVYFFGITNEEPALKAPLVGIHHPAGSYKRIVFGFRTTDETVGVLDVDGVKASPADRYYQMHQREGRVEGGSSGSPLLNDRKQLVGTLSSGPVFSPDPAEDDVLLCQSDEAIFQYGRLSKAFENLRPYIEDLRPARIAVPRAGDKFTASRVKFQWDPGVGVTEYRLTVGRTKGSVEYADLAVRGAQEAWVEKLPEDGSLVHARLYSKVDGKWETADYSYVSSSGSASKGARITSPANDSTFTSSRVEFTWDEGTGVTEYLLHVGSTPGGIEYTRRLMGKSRSAVVANLPGNGQTVYVRIHSRLSTGWVYNEAIYRATTSQARNYTLRVSNRLAYPVSILVNERSIMSVRAGQSAEQVLPRNGEVTVEWRLLRPTHPGSGLPLGEAIGDTLATVTPAEELNFEVSNVSKGVTYFTPVVTNQSGKTFFVEMNSGQASRGVAGAVVSGTQALGLGYYALGIVSNVRGYYGSYGYTGASVDVRSIGESAEPGSGIVAIDLAVPGNQ